MSGGYGIKGVALFGLCALALFACEGDAPSRGTSGCVGSDCIDLDASDGSEPDGTDVPDAEPPPPEDDADAGPDSEEELDVPTPLEDARADTDTATEDVPSGDADDVAEEPDVDDVADTDTTSDGRDGTDSDADAPTPFSRLRVEARLDAELPGGTEGRENGWMEAGENVRMAVRLTNPEDREARLETVTLRWTGIDVAERDVEWEGPLEGGASTEWVFAEGIVEVEASEVVVEAHLGEETVRLQGPVRRLGFVLEPVVVVAGDDAIFSAGEQGTVEFPWRNIGRSLPPRPSPFETPPDDAVELQLLVRGDTVPGQLISLPTRVPLPIDEGAAVVPAMSAALRIADDAEPGAPICLTALARLRSGDRTLLEVSDSWCSTVEFGDAEFCIDEDDDGWGFGSLCLGLDCDDSRDDVFPGAPELCDGVDNDCDGEIDEGLFVTGYRDADNDGFGDATESEVFCGALPPGWVTDSTDCDDTRDDVYPGAPELCDERDNDCDTVVDEGARALWYRDDDGDGWGRDDVSAAFCFGEAPDGWAPRGGDCNDSNEDVRPDAEEVCDGLDTNCDRLVDNVDQIVYPDVDGDTYGDRTRPLAGCPPDDGTSWIPRGGDCNDSDGSVNPGADEICDGVDNNCNGAIDEGFDLTSDIANCGSCGFRCPAGLYECRFGACEGYCLDQDGDGWPGPGNCANANADCNDNNDAIFPGAVEICGDGIDQNCDGRDDVCPTPCDPADAGQCPAGAKCGLLGDAFRCVANGTVPRGGLCAGEGVVDNCTGGNLCVAWDLLPATSCHQICSLPGSTEGSDQRCSDLDAVCRVRLVDALDRTLTNFCADSPQCDPTIPAVCGGGLACRQYRDVRLPRDTFRCLPPPDGGLPIGGNCTAPEDFCQAGLTCVGGPDEFFCRSICRLGTTCPGGGACAGISSPTWPTDYGFCR